MLIRLIKCGQLMYRSVLCPFQTSLLLNSPIAGWMGRLVDLSGKFEPRTLIRGSRDSQLLHRLRYMRSEGLKLKT